jgi:hypothetical protein
MMAQPRPLKFQQVLPLQKGLVFWLPLNERSGAKAYDRSGKGNHGTLNLPAWIVRGLHFDGLDDYISVPSAASLDITTAITLAAWARPSIFYDNYPKLITKPAGAGWSPPYFYYALGIGLTDYRPVIGVISSTYQLSGDALTVGTLYFIAGTYDGAYLRIYVNGIEINNLAVTGAIPTSTQPLAIGIRSITNPQERFHGDMYSPRIYNRALNAAEIKRIYESELMVIR